MAVTTYEQAKDYLESFIRPTLFQKITLKDGQESDPLERMRVLLQLLGDPHKRFPSVLVSGTAGKGSTAYLLSHSLTTAGYTTGLTISPHLEKITERMQINGEQITEEEFVTLVNAVQPCIEQMKQMVVGEPSYFEILLAIAFLAFARKKVDIAIVEVGIEGKYDATGVLSPLVFILTNISLDHTKILGDTVESIAHEATGVIKSFGKDTVVISGIEQSSVQTIVNMACEVSGAKLLLAGRDFQSVVRTTTISGEIFDYKGEQVLLGLQLSLRGSYQANNAALAITALIALENHGFHVGEAQLRHALASAFFPGRFELFSSGQQQIILDGAHNPIKMQMFINSLQKVYSGQRFVFVLAFKQDKDITEMLSVVMPIADTILFTSFAQVTDMSKRIAADPEDLRKKAEGLQRDERVSIEVIADSAEAVTKAKTIAADKKRLLVITGSLYLAGEIRPLL